ncbi:hypothetical protein CsSME_00032018 [Camellia sinensis var. sinensis]|uniref:uncharacterized protein LOC114298507 n=1 Tax=Camellia sinensis TaxID=4442 RepID=UPI001036EF30|nr:uncharacterized protein LOC114298507 [Camellia sinensis]
MAEKEGGIIKKGHEKGTKMAVSILKQFELSTGLLSLADVIEMGFVSSTGYMWIVQTKKVEHKFKLISKLKRRIKKIKGVKAKELMSWPPVSEIIADKPPTQKIHFKSLAGITKTFPIEAFVAGQ